MSTGDRSSNSIEAGHGGFRKFGLVLALVTFALAFVSIWRSRDNLVIPLFSLSGLFFVISLVYPAALSPLHWIMLKIAGYMGWINTRIILVLVYYLIFTPVALLFRLLGKDPLRRKFDRSAESYWIRREGKRKDAAHYERQY